MKIASNVKEAVEAMFENAERERDEVERKPLVSVWPQDRATRLALLALPRYANASRAWSSTLV